jgi:hypothetical protein
VSPALLRDLIHSAKHLRLGPGPHFFTSRKMDAPGARAVSVPTAAIAAVRTTSLTVRSGAAATSQSRQTNR